MENRHVLYGRYDLYSESDIADFFQRNGLTLVSINADDDLLDIDVDHVGEYFLGFAGFRLCDSYFIGPRPAFEYVISHPVLISAWMAFIANHIYHSPDTHQSSVEELSNLKTPSDDA